MWMLCSLDAMLFPYDTVTHSLTLLKPLSQHDLAGCDPAGFPLLCYFLTELPLLSQKVNNVKKTVLFVFS